MTEPAGTAKRQPRAFRLDDPAVAPVTAAPPGPGPAAASSFEPESQPAAQVRPDLADIGRGLRWGAILLAAATALAGLAFVAWLQSFVTAALQRDDWLGWLAAGLLGVAGLAALMLLARELIGLLRLRRLTRLRAEVSGALASGNVTPANAAVSALDALYAPRADMRWPRARLAEHRADVHSAHEILRLADRTLMAPLDTAARQTVLAAAKRVGVVTAMSPMPLIAMLYVLGESLRMIRAIAGLYGGRPGLIGSFKLARLVVGHVVATGGLAFTDDLIGQFLGQDLLRRLSRRLGEGAFNGALTARVGAACIEVARPLPFIEQAPVRARDILAELFRKTPAKP